MRIVPFILFLFLGLGPCYAEPLVVRQEIAVESGPFVFRHFHDWGPLKIEALFSDCAQRNHEKFFSNENDFSYVELRDSNGKVLFHSPSPAFTKLWISPDSRFFVGLSNIKLHNPYQLVIWDRNGRLVHREHISAEVAKVSWKERYYISSHCKEAKPFLNDRYFSHTDGMYLDYAFTAIQEKLPGEVWDYLSRYKVPHPYSEDFTEPDANHINWFDVEHSEPSLDRSKIDWTFSIRSPSGRKITIPLIDESMRNWLEQGFKDVATIESFESDRVGDSFKSMSLTKVIRDPKLIEEFRSVVFDGRLGKGFWISDDFGQSWWVLRDKDNRARIAFHCVGNEFPSCIHPHTPPDDVFPSAPGDEAPRGEPYVGMNNDLQVNMKRWRDFRDRIKLH